MTDQTLPCRPVPPRWYTQEEIEHCLQRMNYSEQVIAELAPWFFRHIESAFKKGFGMGSNTRAQSSAPDGGEAVYVECRQCDSCDHIGINDSSRTQSACNSCRWIGPKPSEDICPECESMGCMTCSCPECGSRYSFLAEASVPTYTRSNAKAGEVESLVSKWRAMIGNQCTTTDADKAIADCAADLEKALSTQRGDGSEMGKS